MIAHIIKYISFKKVINVIRIYVGYYLSIVFKKAIVLGKPFSLTTEPTNKCNLQCVECPTGNKTSNRTKGNLDLNNYKKVIGEVRDYIIYQMIYFQGEPFLNPDIFELIRYSDQNKIYTTTSTNGHFLDQENCKKIIQSGLKKILISLDGTTQESYEKYRQGGNFEKVVSGIKTLVEEKKKSGSKFPLIHIQFLVFKHNEQEIKDIIQLAKSLQVDELEFKSAQVEDLKRNQALIPGIAKFSRYDKSLRIKNKLANRCIRIWSTLIISWEGKIAPCCFDKNLDYTIEDSNTKSVLYIWKSKPFNDFRETVLINRKNISICRNCSEGLLIKY